MWIEETDARVTAEEHGQRQAVQRGKTDVEVTDRHPRHSGWLNACCRWRRNHIPTNAVTNAAQDQQSPPIGRGEIFRPARPRERAPAVQNQSMAE